MHVRRVRRRLGAGVVAAATMGAAFFVAVPGAQAISPSNDDIANAAALTLTSGVASTPTVDNSGATTEDSNADEYLYEGHDYSASVWYKFQPGQGRVSITFSSPTIPNVVATVLTTSDNDPPDGNNSDFSQVGGDDNIINTDSNNPSTAQARTNGTNSSQTFSFQTDNYWVADSNHYYYLGLATSTDDSPVTGLINLSVTWTAAPANDNFANATAISTSQTTYTGDTTTATPELDDNNSNVDPYVGQSSMFSVWYKFTPASNGQVAFSDSGTTAFTPVFEFCTSTVPSASDCSDNDVTDSGSDPPLRSAKITVAKNTTYYLFLDGLASGTTGRNGFGAYSFTFTFTAAPANDDPAGAVLLKPTGVSVVTGTNVGATAEDYNGMYFNGGEQHSVFYRFKPDKGGTYVLFTGGTLNTDVAVFRGSAAAGFSNIAENDNYSAGRKFSRLSFTAGSGGTYTIGVDGAESANYPQGTFTLVLGPEAANDNHGAAAYLAKSKATKIVKKKHHKKKKVKFTASKGSGKVSGSTDFATFESDEKSPKSYTGKADVWYTFVAPKAATYTFTESMTDVETGSAGPALIAAYSGKGTSNFGLKLVADDSNPSTKAPAKIKLKAKAGQKFLISVDGDTGVFGSFTLSWS